MMRAGGVRLSVQRLVRGGSGTQAGGRWLLAIPRGVLRGLRSPRRAFLVVAVLVFVVVAAGAPGRQPAEVGATSTIGVENSWIRVQNIGSADATVEVQYFDESGVVVGRDVCPTEGVCPALRPGEGWTFFQKDNPSLPVGFRGSAVITSDQPLVAILAKDVIRDGKFFLIAGDTLTVGAGSHRLYLPLISNQDGPLSDWNGSFAIQNMSPSVTACVTITYLSNYTDTEVHWDPYNPNLEAVTRLPGCPNGGRPLPPRGSIFRDPDTMGVPPGFTGSVRIDLHTNGDGAPPSRQFISATAETWNKLFNPFSSYRALDEGELGKTVVLPLVDRQVGPDDQWSTYFQLVNKDPEEPAEVSLRFEGWDLGQDPPQFVVKTNTIPVKSARMCFQNSDTYANCLAPGDRLPRRFVGTARLTSTQPIGVVVNRSSDRVDVFTSYRGVRPEDGATRVLLPVLNKNYGPVADRRGWNSWFRVLVADGGAANVEVRYFGRNIPGGEVAYSQQVFREFTVFQDQESVLPDGFAGSAILTSDRPIVALANLSTDVFTGDTDFIYNAISLP
jgi:hypothetical protein